jgi:hypothetical protein
VPEWKTRGVSGSRGRPATADRDPQSLVPVPYLSDRLPSVDMLRHRAVDKLTGAF